MSPEVVSTPEAVSGHLAAALRSMTSPFNDVIGPLLIPHPLYRPPLLSLTDLTTFHQRLGALPEVTPRRFDGDGAESAASDASETGNGSASCEEDCDDAVCSVASVLPLDLSPTRSQRADNFRHHGNCHRC